VKNATLLAAVIFLLITGGCGSSEDSNSPERDATVVPQSSDKDSTSKSAESSDLNGGSPKSDDERSTTEPGSTQDPPPVMSDSGTFGLATTATGDDDRSTVSSSPKDSSPPPPVATASTGQSGDSTVAPTPDEEPSAADPSSEAVDLKAGEQYVSGTLVNIAALGISFRIPDGWYGGIPPNTDALILVSNTDLGLVMAVGQQGTSVEEVVAVMSQSFPLDETTFLFPASDPQVQGNWIAVQYGGTDGTNPVIGYSMARVDANGNGVLFLTTGPETSADYYAELVGQLANSTVTGTASATSAPADSPVSPNASSPLAQQWTEFLAGQRLAYLHNFESGSVSSSVDRKIYLCSSGQFYFTEESLVTGGGGYDPTQTEDSGQWQVLTEGESAGLELRWSSGDTSAHLMESQNGETYIDRERWFVTDDNNFCQ